MAITKLHKEKRVKNWAVLLAIFAFVLILFGITIVRLQQGMSIDASSI